MEYKRIISVDPSTVKTGVALFVRGKLKKYELFDLSKEPSGDARVWKMCNMVDSFIATSKPDIVVIEDIYASRNVRSVIVLAHLQGVLLYKLSTRKLPSILTSSTEWRRALSFDMSRGRKREDFKKAAKEYVRNKFNIEASEDVCDAICIGDAFLCSEGTIKKRD